MENSKSSVLVTRILGNDVPGLHSDNQTIINLEFTLKNEKKYEEIDKLFILNRIYRSDMKEKIINILQKYNEKFIDIPFCNEMFKDQYYSLPHTIPDIYDNRDEIIEYIIDTANSKTRKGSKNPRVIFNERIGKNNKEFLDNMNLYIVNNNGSRNYALDYGKKNGYIWSYILDGNSYIDDVLAKEIINNCNNNDYRYFIINQKRIQEKKYLNNEILQDIKIIDELPDREPQIAFHKLSKEYFDERIPYGQSPKAEFIAALNVHHENNDWDRWRNTICKELNIPIRTINEPWKHLSRIVRLNSHSENNNVKNNNYLRLFGVILNIKSICDMYGHNFCKI